MLMPLDFKKKKENKIISFIKRYWLYLSLSLVILILFLLLSPYIFRSWTKYPEALRVEIAWRHFQATFQGACREDCLAQRQTYASIWRPYYKRHPEEANNNFSLALSGGSEELSAALIKIMAADSEDGILPPLLAQIISNPEASAENKRLIVNLFPAAFQDEVWQEQLREMINNNALDLRERVYAIELLASFPVEANINVLKTIILQVSPEPLLTTASRVIAAWPENSVLWSESEVMTLGDLIPRVERGPARWRRLWILNSLAKKYPEIIRSILSPLALNEKLDLISRGLAAEALQSYFALKIETPVPSSQDWQEFYDSL